MQRMAGWKGVFALAGERDAVDVSEPAVRTSLVEHGLQSVRQQRRSDRNQQRVVAGTPKRFAPSARGNPARGLAQWASDVVIGFALGAVLERLLRLSTGYPFESSKEDHHANS